MHQFAMAADLARADLDGDGQLNQDEFIRGLLPLVALRKVFSPDAMNK